MTLRKKHTFLDNDIFFPAYREQMGRIIANSRVTVAANGDSIIGFSITSDPDVLHFVYVKKDYRHAGVGTDLISHLGPYPRYTTTTNHGRWYLKLGHYDPQYWWRRKQPAIESASLPTPEE
jgi:GNAT superfamily N-acetyltransferase